MAANRTLLLDVYKRQLYYSGDFDGAAAAFFRQADVFYGQMAQMQPSGGYSNSYNSGGEWNAPAKTGSGGVSLGSVVLLIVAILVVWALLDRVRYNRYRRRYILGAPVNVVRPVYYPIFWGRHLRPRPPVSYTHLALRHPRAVPV